ncbi:MAG: hypothetical protein KF858_10070 [Candidatus Sumerlaeia bacterium]|nr:hypothetical protein [Candidatus Sumerlaeia bacterium]
MPMPDFSTIRVLIVVMTYPHPSQDYKELLCTAGISEDGKWVRLYPIDYRYRPPDQRFRKWQWIEVALSDRGAANDPRPESRRPDLDSIRILGEPIGAGQRDVWTPRREVIDPMPHHTIAQLKQLYDRDRTSLGIVRPTEVLDIDVRPADPEWKPEWQAVFERLDLFDGQPKMLRKLPYSFHYLFRCEDTGDKPHTAMIEDWELGVLFLKEVERLGSEEKAAQSVRAKYLNQLCSPERDTRFFMGTRFPYNTWLVLGVFWPPRIPGGQIELF